MGEGAGVGGGVGGWARAGLVVNRAITRMTKMVAVRIAARGGCIEWRMVHSFERVTLGKCGFGVLGV